MCWLLSTITRFTPFPAPLAFVLFALFCAVHGLVWGCWAGTTRVLAPRLSRRLGGWEDAALALVTVPGLVWGHAYFPSIFPAPFAVTQLAHLPAVQSLELLGTAGLAWILVSFNVAAYLALRSWRRDGKPRLGPLAAAALAAALNEGYGRWRIPRVEKDVAAAPGFSVGIVQASIPLDALRERKKLKLEAHNLLTHELLSRSSPDLVVWPETSYEQQVLFKMDADKPSEPLLSGRPLSETLAKEIPHPVPLLLGALAVTPSAKKFNVALLTGAKREFLGVAEKRYLMPFGEFIPLGGFFPRLYRLSPRSTLLTPSPQQRLIPAPKGGRLGALICYEDLIAGYVRDYARMGANLLVVLANDAWIGAGTGPETHLRLSALRAIENRRYLVRAVNTGVSAVIDPVGRVVRRLDVETRGTIDASVSLMESRTPYMALGDFLYHVAALLWLGLAIYAWRA